MAAINETRGQHRTEALGWRTDQVLDRLGGLPDDEDPSVALRAGRPRVSGVDRITQCPSGDTPLMPRVAWVGLPIPCFVQGLGRPNIQRGLEARTIAP